MLGITPSPEAKSKRIVVGAGRGKIVQIKTRWKILTAGLAVGMAILPAQEKAPPSSYAPVDIHESFASIMGRMSAAKPGIVKR